MKFYTYEKIVEKWGKPIFRFKPHGNFTDEEKLSGDIPTECLVVKIDHVSEYMVLSEISKNQWFANHGERWVIRELLRRIK